ncbi:TPA: hypothetical protein ACGCES_003714, partial [Vibrio cholerae]
PTKDKTDDLWNDSCPLLNQMKIYFNPTPKGIERKQKLPIAKRRFFRMLSEKPSDFCSNSFEAH